MERKRGEVQQLRNAILDDKPEVVAQLWREYHLATNTSVYFRLPASQRRVVVVGTLDSDVCPVAPSHSHPGGAGAAPWTGASGQAAVGVGGPHAGGAGGGGVGAEARATGGGGGVSALAAAAALRRRDPRNAAVQAAAAMGTLPVCLPLHFAVLSGSGAVIEWLLRRSPTVAPSVTHWSGRSVFDLARALPADLQKLVVAGGSSGSGSSGGLGGAAGGGFDDESADARSVQSLRDLDAALQDVQRQRVLVADFHRALRQRKAMSQMQLGCGLHLLLYVALVLYACAPAAPWLSDSNVATLLTTTFEDAVFTTEAFADSTVSFQASFGDVYSMGMFADWFEQVLLPTMHAAHDNAWQPPATTNVHYLQGAYVRQLRVRAATGATECSCGGNSASTATATTTSTATTLLTAGVCFPEWSLVCADTSSITVGTLQPLVVEFSSASDSSLNGVRGNFDFYEGVGQIVHIDNMTIAQVRCVCVCGCVCVSVCLCVCVSARVCEARCVCE
jgi:hypothetical protein